MASGVRVSTSGAVNTGAAATTTSTPGYTDLDALGLLVYAVRHATTGFGNPDSTTVTGGGLTWTHVTTVWNNSNQEMMGVWEGRGTPDGTALTITFSQAPSSGRYCWLDARSANRASGSGVQATWSATGSSGTTGTVSSITGLGGTTMIGFWSHSTAQVHTPDTTDVTWTEWHDASTTSIALQVQAALGGGDKTHTSTWATSSRWMGIVVELKCYNYFPAAIFDDDIIVMGAMQAQLLTEDEEGAVAAGKPSGVWAILGGPGA